MALLEQCSQQASSLPLLANPSTYTARTFDYFASEHQGADVSLRTWLEMFRSSIPSFQRQAAQDPSLSDAQEKADKFASSYGQMLDTLLADPWAEIPGHGSGELNCVRLCKLREHCLRAAGFGDIYAEVKAQENQKAMQMLPVILSDLDCQTNIALRLGQSLRGIFAGNVFDLGAVASAQLFEEAGSSFVKTRDNLVPRPWVIDDYEVVLQQLSNHRYKKAMLFVDNCGSDVVLGMLPFARELLKLGTQVVLAANSVHSINDITAAELDAILKEAAGSDQIIDRAAAEQMLLVVESGNDLPVIDLANVSPILAEASQGVDLVVLEGMGRAIETNLNAELTCDKMNFGMIKHPEVAAMLGGRLYDCVCKFSRGAGSTEICS